MLHPVRSAYSKITTPHFQGLSPTTSKKNDAEDLGQLFFVEHKFNIEKQV